MATNPYTAGVFYEGSFISKEFVQAFSELGVDRRVAILAEISARPQFSQFVIHRVFATVPVLTQLPAVYAYFYINTSGVLSSQTFPVQVADMTDQWLSASPPPKYLVFTDSELNYRYVTSSTGTNPTLSASATKPSPSLDDAQFVGEYLEMIGRDGISIYRVSVNTSNQILVTLNRVEPQRAAPIRISNGHPFAYDGVNLWIEGLISISDVSMSVDEYLSGYSGVTTPRLGTVHVQLADAWFRYLIQQSWDTRTIEIKIGFTDEPIGNYRVILRAKTERAEANLNELVISLRDHSILLDKPMQDNTFEATGIYEGTGDIAGRLKPLAYGLVRHAAPILIDELRSLYVIHDGPVHEIFSIHVGGILMTNIGDLTTFTQFNNLLDWVPHQAQVDMGGYVTDYANGAFRLAGRPQGAITVSFWGSTSVPKSTSRISEIASAILALRLPELARNQNEFDTFTTEQGGGAGIYISDDMSIRDVLHALVAPVGAVVYVNAQNVVGIKRMRARTPVAILGKHNLIEDVMPSRRNPPKPAAFYRIGYYRNWTVLNETDLLNTSNTNIRIFLQRQFSYRNAIWYGRGAVRLPAYESAPTCVYETTLDNIDAASKLAAFIEFRDHQMQNLYEATAVGFSFQIDIGDTVLFQVEELGTWNTKTGIVVEVIEKSITSSQEDFTQLLIWA